MTEPDETRRNPRRRKERGPKAAIYEAPPTDTSPPPSIVAVIAAAPVAPPVHAAPAAPAPRAPTDFEGLRAIGQLGRDEVRAAMEAAMGGSRSQGFQPGQRVRGRVSSLGQMSVFIDIGGKADAVIDRIELGEVALGDRVDAFVHSTDGGEVRLTCTPSGDAAREMLREAMSGKLPVDGKITSVNAGGWQVALSGGTRAFCPASHTGSESVEDADHVGRSHSFLVHDLRGNDVVVSRRAIVEDEERKANEERLGAVREGEVYDGTVVSLREFGAFVKLSNGVEGLVHNSNLADPRPKLASEVVQEGQAVRVRVLGIDRARRRVDLGMRQAVEHSSAARGSETSRGFGLFAGLLKDVKVKK